jgi:NAD(P)-dependent dehydrogenase (short-subunit alcohol dehydrogenase family)
VARELATEGANVGLVARTPAHCENLASEIGATAIAIPADVRDSAQCEAVATAVADRFGPPTVLINAAGVSPVRQPAEVHDLEAFREIIDVNLLGAFQMTRAVSRTLLDHGGAIVNVASMLGARGSPRMAAYGASKAAVIQLTRTLAREWGNRNVRVNAVCPGYVETDLTRKMLAVEAIRNEIVGATSLGRLAALNEVVAPVLFLASSEASYITGATLFVDGGTTA